MSSTPDQPKYFTKHLFKTGLVCPTKLYYKAKNYPENRQSVPFIRHAVFNKRMLKALARSAWPEGIFIDTASVAEATQQTHRQLEAETTVLFDAVFEHQQMMARLPIIERKGGTLNVFKIQTKAYNSNHHTLLDNQGRIHSKWRVYLLNFAYQLYIIRQSLPHLALNPILVLPDKAGHVAADHLPYRLMESYRKRVPPTISGDNRKALVELEVEEHISRIWHDPDFARQFLPKDTFRQSLLYLRQLFMEQKKFPPPIGAKCKNCEFRLETERAREGEQSGFTECWSPHTAAVNDTREHVFDLIGPGTEKWLREGIFDQRQIPEEELTSLNELQNSDGRINQKMRQALQIYQSKGYRVPEEIIRPALHRELKQWKYPLHFLDFEAANYAIPPRGARRPYHLIVFQFSCHTLREDGRWQHHQWIDDGESDYCNYELVRQLMQVPYINEGTIVQYSNFERNALKLIRRELLNEPESVDGAGEMSVWIEKILQRRDSSHRQPPYVADLSRQVKHFYYNRQMSNSLSIKDVLHSIMKDSEFLRQRYSRPYDSQNFSSMIWWQTDKQGEVCSPYQLLTDIDSKGVRRGTEAMVAYGKLISGNLSDQHRQAFRRSLFRYCELDTLAMLMIFQHWQHQLQTHADQWG